MNKPCIIGTRVATQVLKTGDIAEVDANMGIVTILSQEDYYLGEPEDIFYWGPSRAKPIFMSDFMSAVEHFFVQLSKDPIMPTPPETLVLFSDNKMVWLSNSKDFNHFVKSVFRLYEKRNKLDEDLGNWRKSMKGLDLRKSDANELVEAWAYTLFPEFSLYGARDVIAERLQRFDQKTRQIIWGAFTLPEKSSFMTRIDEELYESKDPVKLALKYPWIEDGYSGTSENAEKYFAKRLKLLNENPPETTSTSTDKQKLINEFGLSDKEVSELSLARQLAEMLDERKEWMMRTRRNITEPASKIEFGWLFKEGGTTLINKDDTDKLWDRYINFKTMSSSLEGMVACSGGEHFITGHVTVLNSPTDSVGNDQILVVPSTSPSYVPLMRKAKALITDHGGMMSHAAIVARELNLPCIVATKQATKVLKTGDKIIIDLARGVISK
jgi:phosphohistidine swiveling domain-containing protein